MTFRQIFKKVKIQPIANCVFYFFVYCGAKFDLNSVSFGVTIATEKKNAPRLKARGVYHIIPQKSC